jgi:hypothetical protein
MRESHLRQEFGPAMICQTIHSLAGKKTPYTNFMPSWKQKRKRDVDWQELLAKTNVLHAAFGGTQ